MSDEKPFWVNMKLKFAFGKSHNQLAVKDSSTSEWNRPLDGVSELLYRISSELHKELKRREDLMGKRGEHDERIEELKRFVTGLNLILAQTIWFADVVQNTNHTLQYKVDAINALNEVTGYFARHKKFLRETVETPAEDIVKELSSISIGSLTAESNPFKTLILKNKVLDEEEKMRA
jgi:hypothetical protein